MTITTCKKCNRKIIMRSYSHHWKLLGLLPGEKETCQHEPIGIKKI